MNILDFDNNLPFELRLRCLQALDNYTKNSISSIVPIEIIDAIILKEDNSFKSIDEAEFSP